MDSITNRGTDKNIVDEVTDDDIYYDYITESIDSEEEEDDDDDEVNSYDFTFDEWQKVFEMMVNQRNIEKDTDVENSEKDLMILVAVDQQPIESSDDDDKEIENELMASLFELNLQTIESSDGFLPQKIENTPISADEQPHNIIITNIELNLVNFDSKQNLNKDEQLPIVVLYEESYNKEKQTGLLLNFNLNLSEEKTFLGLAVLGIIISSVCVTVFLARLQRKRLENMSGENRLNIL